jgi:hypothetical protein
VHPSSCPSEVVTIPRRHRCGGSEGVRVREGRKGGAKPIEIPP